MTRIIYKPTSKVLVMHLVGGIGNQLFCYYAGKVLANQGDRRLSLDFSDVNYGHNIEDIANFNISCVCQKSTTKAILKRLFLYRYVQALNYKIRLPRVLKGTILFPINELEISDLSKFRKKKKNSCRGLLSVA